MKKNHDEELEESESEDSDSDSEDSDSDSEDSDSSYSSEYSDLDSSEYSDLDSSEEADDTEIKLKVRVLSWNINGGTQRGKSERRNLYVPEVVRIVDPDVLLLQEVPSEKIMKMLAPYGIIPRCKEKNNRKYRSVYTRPIEKRREKKHEKLKTIKKAKKRKGKEARILYDSKLFEKLAPVKLDRHIAKAFPDQEKVKGKKLKKDRVAIVRLRHKKTGKVIVFLSFHNIRHGGTKLVTGFCEIVRMIAKHEKLPVVVGADLNYKEDFSSAASSVHVHVPKYDLTKRRSSGSKGKIDFFLHSSPSTGVVPVKIEGSVSALDVFPRDDRTDNRFHLQKMRKCNRKHSVGEYSASLNHDPLRYRLTVIWEPA